MIETRADLLEASAFNEQAAFVTKANKHLVDGANNFQLQCATAAAILEQFGIRPGGNVRRQFRKTTIAIDSYL